MSLQACADVVARGDPDRFRAAMAAPVAARRVLFPLYAFNVEVARAPWVTAEPLIAEMRLQWWIDALAEVETGAVVRRHEVVTPLAAVLIPSDVPILQRMIEARRREARREPLIAAADLATFASDTAGSLFWVAAHALDRDQDLQVIASRAQAVGLLSGLANYFLAVPDFLARGLNPLPDMTERAFADLIDAALAAPAGRAPTRAQRIAELPAWRARGILKRARRDPAAVPKGGLEEAPFLRQMALLWAARGL
ncbi:MAG: squalene/phytoene synthase family protein [Pseudomonadota bacterium]